MSTKTGMFALLEEMTRHMEMVLSHFDIVTPKSLGLQNRSAKAIWVYEDSLIVHAEDERNMEYYANFTRIADTSRSRIGDYVVYLATDSRVKEIIQLHYSKKKEKVA